MRFYSSDGVKEAHGAVQDTERAFHLQGEIHVTGGVDDVNTVFLPSARRSGARDGDPAFLFLFHPVHGRRAFVHFADFVRLAGVKKHALRGGGLSGVDVRHDADVAVLIQRDFPAIRADHE